jgi:hypothetical protein
LNDGDIDGAEQLFAAMELSRVKGQWSLRGDAIKARKKLLTTTAGRQRAKPPAHHSHPRRFGLDCDEGDGKGPHSPV